LRTPQTKTQGALGALILAVIIYTLRTTPGLIAITFGSGAMALGRPWTGLIIATVGALIYSEQCHRTPYAPCWRCSGIGYRPRRWRRHQLRACRPCRGRGVRIRWGRAAMNAYRRATYTPPVPTTAPVARSARRPGPVDMPEAIRRRLSGH
jgi:hypothetical protein